MAEQTRPDLEASKKSTQQWDSMADWYEKTSEQYTTQGFVSCAVMSSLFSTDRPQKVLEVACGPGKHSLLISQNWLRPTGAVLVSCDISGAMVEKLERNYKDADYSFVTGNESAFEKELDYGEMTDEAELVHKCDLNEVIRKTVQDRSFRKFVYGCRANNELLPFADETFSAVSLTIASALSLSLSLKTVAVGHPHFTTTLASVLPPTCRQLSPAHPALSTWRT